MSVPAPPPSDRQLRAVRRSTLRQDAFNIPNLLTFARVLMIPVCLWFLDQNTRRSCFWAGIIFTLASLTDALDGYLARKMNVVSVLGKLLDPLADKLIVMAVLIWMVFLGRAPAWIVVLLIGREITITAIRSVAASSGVVIAAGQEGKVKTALQMIGVIALIVGYPYPMHYAWIDLGFVDTARVGRAFLYLSLGFSLASAAQYVVLFAQAVEASNESRS